MLVDHTGGNSSLHRVLEAPRVRRVQGFSSAPPPLGRRRQLNDFSATRRPSADDVNPASASWSPRAAEKKS